MTAWGFAAFGTFVALCSVPSLVSLELRRLTEQTRPGGWRWQLARARAVAAGLVFLAWGASYLWLVASHVGLIRAAEAVR